MKRFLLALAALLLAAQPVCAQWVGPGTPPAAGGSGAVSSVTGTGLVSVSPTTGATVASLGNLNSGDLAANCTGSTAAPSDTTFTSCMDRNIGSTQGMIAYRNGTVWTALATGTSGQFLQTGGAAANPVWAGAAGLTGTPTTGNCANFASATNVQDAGFVCAPGLPMVITSGNWYEPPYFILGAGTALTVNRMTCIPQFNPGPAFSVKTLGARVTTGGSTNIQLAIYANSGGFPNGAALASTANIADTPAGLVSSAVTVFTLPAGVYWACIVAGDSTVIMQTVANSMAWYSAMNGSATQATVNSGAGAVGMAIFQAFTFGSAWPTLSSSGWTQVASAGNGAVVMVQAN